ncbi:MAG: hypothetical protein R3E53_07440 [Myxococcota bacterium]
MSGGDQPITQPASDPGLVHEEQEGLGRLEAARIHGGLPRRHEAPVSDVLETNGVGRRAGSIVGATRSMK